MIWNEPFAICSAPAAQWIRQDLQSAFQNYMRSAHTDLVKLMNYAREFRLVNVMRPYLEAVMPAWFTGEFIL